MKRTLLLIALVIPLLITAQNDSEALRYSRYDLSGSARYISTGGAFQAVGGDFTSLSYNPAGLAVYVGSELVGTPNLSFNTAHTDFLGNMDKATRFNFNMDNLGLVIHKKNTKTSEDKLGKGWISTTFAVGYNRMANFNNEVRMSGINNSSSLTDRYLEDLNAGEGTWPSDVYNNYPFGAGLAYEAYIIDPLPTDTMHYSSRIPNGGVEQSKQIRSKGAIDEWLLAIGANNNNKLYVGATLGIPFLRYREEVQYTETDIADTIAGFETFTQTDSLYTRGTGVNLKVGLIYRFTYSFRVGFSIHTPTAYFMRDLYSSSLYSNLGNDEEYNAISPEGSFEYTFLTPWRFMGGVSYVFKDMGFLSLDLEHVTYGGAKYKFNGEENDAFENELNDAIKTKYGSVTTLKIGGEYKMGMWRLRGGYNVFGPAFRKDFENTGGDYSGQNFSLGLGIRTDWLYADIAYKNGQHSENHAPYTLEDPTREFGVSEIKNRKESVSVTMGFRF